MKSIIIGILALATALLIQSCGREDYKYNFENAPTVITDYDMEVIIPGEAHSDLPQGSTVRLLGVFSNYELGNYWVVETADGQRRLAHYSWFDHDDYPDVPIFDASYRHYVRNFEPVGMSAEELKAALGEPLLSEYEVRDYDGSNDTVRTLIYPQIFIADNSHYLTGFSVMEYPDGSIVYMEPLGEHYDWFGKLPGYERILALNLAPGNGSTLSEVKSYSEPAKLPLILWGVLLFALEAFLPAALFYWATRNWVWIVYLMVFIYILYGIWLHVCAITLLDRYHYVWAWLACLFPIIGGICFYILVFRHADNATKCPKCHRNQWHMMEKPIPAMPDKVEFPLFTAGNDGSGPWARIAWKARVTRYYTVEETCMHCGYQRYEDRKESNIVERTTCPQCESSKLEGGIVDRKVSGDTISGTIYCKCHACGYFDSRSFSSTQHYKAPRPVPSTPISSGPWKPKVYRVSQGGKYYTLTQNSKYSEIDYDDEYGKRWERWSNGWKSPYN